MTNQQKDKNAPQEPKAGEAAAEESVWAQPTEPEASNDAGAPTEEDVLAKLAAENEELKDQALRLAAEMDNLRKRTARDVQEARTYGIANFARDMLTVSDNLRRALEAVPQDDQGSGNEGLKALVEGVDMTERAMLSALERHGVKKIEPEGEKFDPNFHQAMFEVPDADAAAGTIVQVVQTGYVIGERVLRPALVGVAKGGAGKSENQAQADAEAEPGPPNPYSEKDA